MSKYKYLIDAVTHDTKYTVSGGRFGLRKAWGGMAIDYQGQNYHIGVDYGTPTGVTLYSIFNKGEVTYVDNIDNGRNYGRNILVYYPVIDKTLHLAHLNSIDVKKGQVVKKDQVLGKTGNTGLSSGPHLHLGLANGRKTNLNKGKYGDNTWLNPSTFYIDNINDTEEVIIDLTDVKGVLTVTTEKGLRERVAPSIEAKVARTNAKGTKLNYVGWLENEGYYWYKLTNGNYTAYRVIGGEKFAEYKDDVAPKPTPKPTPPKFKPYSFTIAKGSTLYSRSGSPYSAKTTNTHTVTITEEVNGLGRFKASWLRGVSEAYVKLNAPSKPVSNVGKTANFKGVYLYLSSTASQPARAKANASYSLKILAEANGRYQVRDAKFNPNTVWVRAQDVKVK